MSKNLAINTLEAAEMCVKDSQVIVLPDGALIIEIEADRLAISALKGVWLNLAMIPIEALHLL